MANAYSNQTDSNHNPYQIVLSQELRLNAENQTVQNQARKPTRPAIIRFLEKIAVSETRFYDSSPCWEWLGCKQSNGYGQFKIDGRRGAPKSSPHRFSHEYFIGPIENGNEADHLCNNRGCCNPLHLEQVTMQINRKRRSERQTHCKAGHSFDDANTYYNKQTGGRVCRACRDERVRQYYQAHPGYNIAHCRKYQQKKKNAT